MPPFPPFPPLPFPIPIGLAPIVLLCSQQKNVRPGFMPFGGLNYLEFAIVLHNIFTNETNTDYNGPYLYMPRILLNSFPAMAIGATAYGFKKRLARIRHVGELLPAAKRRWRSLGAIRERFPARADPRLPCAPIR